MVGILTRNPRGWATTRLARAIESLGHRPLSLRFRDLVAVVEGGRLRVLLGDTDVLEALSAVIVRPIGRCSLEWAVFRMDLLYAVEERGVTVVNRPSAIERCVDKFRALYTLSVHGVPVPPTVVGERARAVLRASQLLGGRHLVIKPVFGSRGHGSTRVRAGDLDLLWEVLHAMAFTRHVLYVQRYVEHGGEDVRALVVGGRVVAAMRRVAPPGAWKTNVARGGRPVGVGRLEPELEELAVRAAEVLGCEVAGVDVASEGGSHYVLEVNSQPGWRGLEEATGKDIAMEVARYVVEKAKR